MEECDSRQEVGHESCMVCDETRELTFYESGLEAEEGAYDCRPSLESTKLYEKDRYGS